MERVLVLITKQWISVLVVPSMMSVELVRSGTQGLPQRLSHPTCLLVIVRNKEGRLVTNFEDAF